MIFMRSKKEQEGRNGRQGEAARSLRAPASCLPACRRIFSSQRGSQILEYAVVILALSGAFTVMYMYGKRGIQGVIRDQVDREIGPQKEFFPLTGGYSNEMTTSVTRSTGQDSGNLTYDRGASYAEVSSVSYSEGNATSISIEKKSAGGTY